MIIVDHVQGWTLINKVINTPLMINFSRSTWARVLRRLYFWKFFERELQDHPLKGVKKGRRLRQWRATASFSLRRP
jgi:hypothetical protein